MNYPLYDENDSFFAEQDGNDLITNFSNFISQLANQDVLTNKTERGIIALVNSKGTK